MQFEYDPEFLIAVVKKRPGIWDFEHPEYREKKTRLRLWGEVVQELMQSDVTMTKAEMRELELQLQKKWKSLRDCFQKYLAHPNKTRRPYLYAKQMQFLLKDQKLPVRAQGIVKESGSPASADEDEEQQRPMWRPRKKLRISKTEDLSEEDDSFEPDNYSSDYNSKPDTSGNVNNSQDTSGHFAFANVDALAKDDDPEKMFLLSLLPHLKSIPEEFRLNAKMELMQVLQQANYSISKLI